MFTWNIPTIIICAVISVVVIAVFIIMIRRELK